MHFDLVEVFLNVDLSLKVSNELFIVDCMRIVRRTERLIYIQFLEHEVLGRICKLVKESEQLLASRLSRHS